MEQLVTIGTMLIIVGVIILFLGTLLSLLKSKQAKTEGGFVFMIGPIPIIGATSKGMFYLMILLSILMVIIFLLLNWKVLS